MFWLVFLSGVVHSRRFCYRQFFFLHELLVLLHVYTHIKQRIFRVATQIIWEHSVHIFFTEKKPLTVIVHRIFKFIMFLGVINFKFSDLLKWKIRSVWLSNYSFCNELSLINILKMIEVTSNNVRCKVNWKTCLTWKNKLRINISVKFDLNTKRERKRDFYHTTF